MKSKSAFGQRLKEAFNDATNGVIGSKLGVSENNVGFYVRGRIPPAETLVRISNVTGCNIHWLLTGNGSKFVVSQIEDAPAEEPLINRDALDKLIREIVRDELRETSNIGGEIEGIEPIGSRDMMLAPVVAHIGPGITEEEAKEDVRRMINQDEITEIERRLRPRKRKAR